MGLLTKIFSAGVPDLLKSAGSLAKDIRTAITGDLSPEDKAALQQKALDLEAMTKQASTELSQMQTNIIIAEAKSQSWLARNWRPLLMLIAMVIVANNYIIYPYLSMFTTKAAILTLPPDLWGLLKIGVGGYVVGRTVEKGIDKWKGNA